MENKEFPTWDEAILGITDPKLKDKVYSKLVRHYVEAGARIMYDRLCSMLSSDAVLTSAMHSDGEGDRATDNHSAMDAPACTGDSDAPLI